MNKPQRVHKNSLIWGIPGTFLVLALLQISACVHPPVYPQEMLPHDTLATDTTVQDTTVQDTIGQDTLTVPPDTFIVRSCDPDTVYFERDLLPILNSNCALSGCHDAQSAQDGVILNNYINTLATADVRPGDPDGSDLYEVLVEDDPDKQMPPGDPLAQSQIDLVFRWIAQGAQDLSCGDTTIVQCDTSQVSFSGFVSPLIQLHCQGCHSGNNPGGGVSLQDHGTIASAAASGRLYGAMAHLQGYSPMPQGTSRRPDCELAKLKAWIEAGSPNN